jgi:putative heme-binding domain-containing protein
MARKIAADRGERPQVLDGLIAALGKVAEAEVQVDLLEGMLDALNGERRIEAPKSWAGAFDSLSADPPEEVARLVAELAVAFSDEKALAGFRDVAADAKEGVEARRRALDVLVRAGAEGMEGLLLAALEVEGLAISAMQGLAAKPTPNAAARVLQRYPTLGMEAGRVAISILSSRAEFAAVLLEAVEKGELPAHVISAFDARQIQSLGVPELEAQLEKAWGTIRKAGPDQQKEAMRIGAVLAAGAAGDAGKGREIFEQRCAACHTLWGEGGQAGPDLTGTDRRNLDYLLENVLDPSASVPQNYRFTLVELKDGQILGGFVEEEVGTAIRLRAQDRMHSIALDRIKKRTLMTASLMPDGLLLGMSDDELRNLFAYLRGSQQVPRGE